MGELLSELVMCDGQGLHDGLELADVQVPNDRQEQRGGREHLDE